jgi:uncharacterized protein YcfL
MKKLFTGILVLLIAGACKSPMPITVNPDDQQGTSGTAGSAKMTYQLPPKPDNVKLPDTMKLRDTLRVKRN